ncbi:hypothetical protein FRC03_010121 [Tulasnella sp. 419]|nr:hypothetical protein FRC03_010121 [Tulasnella sp. 419]
MNKQIIKLSKDAPLHTDLRYPMCTEVEGKMILECLAQEVSRWKGIICNSSQMVDMIDPIVKDGAATILESFQWTGIDQASCEVPSLIQERAPRLRELAIMDLPLVPLDLPILSRIKVLRFDPSFDMYQSHTHWERLLSSIPEIETLEVHCPYPTATNSLDEEFSIVFDVRLLHLRHLYLYDLPSWIPGKIVSSIILDPNQDCPFVSIRLGNEHHEPLPGSFPAISRSSSLLCIIRDSATELIFRGLNRWDVMHQDRYIFQFAGDWSTDGDGSEADTLRVVLGPLNNLHLTTLGI